MKSNRLITDMEYVLKEFDLIIYKADLKDNVALLKLVEQALLDSARRLEKKVISTQSELRKNTEESPELNILQINIAELINSTGERNTLTSIYQLLTPVEIQVASMIRLGYPTQKIAQSLLISLGTVNIHRKHIRKKLKLNGKPINLFSYLLTLTE